MWEVRLAEIRILRVEEMPRWSSAVDSGAGVFAAAELIVQRRQAFGGA